MDLCTYVEVHTSIFLSAKKQNEWNNHHCAACTVEENTLPNLSMQLKTSYIILLPEIIGLAGLGAFPIPAFFNQSEQPDDAHQKNSIFLILWFGQVFIVAWCSESRWAHIWNPNNCVPFHMLHWSTWKMWYYNPRDVAILSKIGGRKRSPWDWFIPQRRNAVTARVSEKPPLPAMWFAIT